MVLSFSLSSLPLPGMAQRMPSPTVCRVRLPDTESSPSVARDGADARCSVVRIPVSASEGPPPSAAAEKANADASRKPRGYWQEPGNLHAELLAFIDVSGGDPDLMPTPSDMHSAGRIDLLRAVTRSGGSAAVAKRFNLRTTRKPNHYWTSPVEGQSSTPSAKMSLRCALADVATEAGLDRPESIMPSVTILLELKRYDLMNAVAKAGGFTKVASEFGLRTMREVRREEAAASASAAAASVRGQASPRAVAGDGEPPKQRKERRDWSSWRVFEQALRAFAVEHCDGNMPTQVELRERQRHDLINALRRHGGVDAVARRAGLSVRTGRRPRGHWRDRAVLLAELGAHTARNGMPGLMPRREELLAAGRSDLYYAIRRHGGFSAVAAELHLIWHGPSTYWRVFRNLQRRLGAYVKQVSAKDPSLAGKMPSTQTLLACGREDLVFGIGTHGGVMQVAARTGLVVEYPDREPGYWTEPHNILREVQSFVLTQALELRNSMPSSILLVEAGRGDLANAIRDHGGWVYYAQRLGLRHSFEVHPQGFWQSADNVCDELVRYVGRRYGNWDFPGIQPHPGAVAFCAPVRTGERTGMGVTDSKGNRSSVKWGRTRDTLRYVPSVEMLKRDGRSDLAFAIQRYQGGEAAFAGRNNLIIAADSNEMRPYEELSRWRVFASEMLRWVDAHGCCGTMPSRSELIRSGRNDLRYAIYSHGGNVVVARRLGLVSLHEPAWIAKWLSLQASRFGLYLSTEKQAGRKGGWTEEEKLPVRVRTSSVVLKLARVREQQRRSLTRKGQARKNSEAWKLASEGKARRGAKENEGGGRSPGEDSEQLRKAKEPTLDRVYNRVLSDVEFEALRQRYAHLPADDIIAP